MITRVGNRGQQTSESFLGLVVPKQRGIAEQLVAPSNGSRGFLFGSLEGRRGYLSEDRMEIILTLLHTALDELVVGDPSVGRSEGSLELISPYRSQ